MKIHKSTDTNATLCGINTPGKIMAVEWKDVDCRNCLKAGQQDFLERFPEIETQNNQPELDLPEDTTQ